MTEEAIVKAVEQIVFALLGEDFKVSLIGSRANNTARVGSDYDFLISGPTAVPLTTLVALQTQAEAFPTLASIDFVDAKTASADFLATVQ